MQTCCLTAFFLASPVPGYYTDALFPFLMHALHGDSGAKPLMDRIPGRVAFVDIDTPVPFDVDTPTDLDRES